MFRVSRSSLVLAAALVASSQANADPRMGGQSNLGGGLIEFLVTGNARSAPAPVYQRPQVEPQRRVAYAPQAQPAYATPSSAAVPELSDEPYQAPRPAMRPQPGQGVAPATMPSVHGFDPRYERQVVTYDGQHRPGTIVIDTPNRFLYLVQENGKALRYGIGVGRPGFEWAGVKSITRKAEWPNWTPPPEMLKRRPDLPRFMEGGPDNPLGARAMYLGSTMYRIHGTNEPSTIGQAVSSGCIRLRNEDVTDLYERVRVGAKVIVI